MLLKALLAASQFDLVEAGDGIEAMDAIERAAGSFDLLITDINMPRMDGVSLARSVSRAFPSIPVLFISAYSPVSESPSRAFGQRWDYLAKPFAPKMLLEKIALLLEPEASSAAGA
jgi:two-component system cell cycle sensor histidine kinase/response regulator CckA